MEQKNNLIKGTLKQVFNELEIPINNVDLFLTAFTHTSYANEHEGTVSNERLEFLGDAILDFLVGEYLYKKYPDMPEGDMSKIRSKYVCASANNEYALSLDLESYLRLGRGERETGGKNKVNVVADEFEAFLGAMYLDSGIENVRKVLNKVIFSNIQVIDKGFFFDYKSKLQEDIQASSRKAIEYRLESETGPAHDKTFKMSVYHDGMRLGEGTGKSKKEAEQLAAKDALSKKVTK